jgi:predicted dehydrogenase
MTGSSNARSPRVIVVGAGEVAESYWLPGAALVRRPVELLDLDHERARSLAARSGREVRSTGSIAEASPGEHDVVVVATPPGTHGAVAREAAAGGARRLVLEKPPFTSMADLDATVRVLERRPTAVSVAFIRRRWRPIATARRLYPGWRERFGPLVAVRITEGRPYGWRSRAASELGIAGLASMLLDEIPHALDAVFGIAGWGLVGELEARPARLEPLEVDVEVELEVNGARPSLRILGSRIAQLPNALDFEFERGSVTVEMQPNGGIVVRDRDGGRTLVRCDGLPTGVETMFADLLTTAASDPLTPRAHGLEAWRGPMAVIEEVQGAA